MRRNFSVSAHIDWRRFLRREAWDRATVLRVALGTLVAANVAAGWFVFHPPGGSLEDLEGQIVAARQQIAARQQSIQRLRRTSDKTVQARLAGDEFLEQYFLPRRHAYSMLLTELDRASKASGIKPKDHTYSYEAVEGSDTLGMLTITANFEGTYADLVGFVNQVDRAQRLVIMEALQAQPVQGSPVLAITIKLDAFFRFDGPQGDLTPDETAADKPVATSEVRR